MGKRRYKSGIIIPWERGGALANLFRGRWVRNLVIGTMLIAGLTWVFRHQAHRARVRETRASVSDVMRAVGSFRADLGRCPTSLAELARGHDGQSPYLREIPRDGWGHRFDMLCPGRKNPEVADIRSMGPDGTWFGMDEIE
jgi:hypothetical protein